MTQDQDVPVLKMQGISKAFPGVQALDAVDFEVKAGEVMAFVGENGAGKSTLLKILAGAQSPDAGEIYLDGEAVEISNPEQAQKLNISVIYQELNLAEHLSVAENIYVSREFRTKLGLIDFRRMNREAQTLLNDALHSTSIESHTEVGRLSVARKQMVEIAKAISLEARIIVMDEPTSSLAGGEVDALLELIDRLRDQGVAVIYTTHRLEEVFRISDRVTVLRDGELVGVRKTEESNQEEIVGMMVGRQLEDLYGDVEEVQSEEVAFEVRGLRRPGQFQDIDFHVRAGEILGIAGLIGAGRTEVARAMFGADPLESGEIIVDGQEVEIRSPSQAIDAGIGYVPEDRKLQGLFLGMSLRENISAASPKSISRNGFIRGQEDKRIAKDAVDQLSISTSSIEQSALSLSGGNQQKVVLAKWLTVRPQVLILDEPTRGVDVGGKAEIFDLIKEMARQEIAIIMISSELTEVLGISNRVVVMREGRVAGELSREEASEEKVMALATGTEQGQEVR